MPTTPIPDDDTGALLALTDDGEDSTADDDAAVTALEPQIAAALGTVDDDPPIDLGAADPGDAIPTVPADWADDDDPDDATGAPVTDIDTVPDGAAGASILGFPASASPSRISIRTYTVPGTRVRVAVAAEVAPLLLAYLRDYHRLVEPLHPGWCWGYAYRLIRNRATISRHAAGIAVDCNAPLHPLGRTGTLSARQKATMRVLARKYGLRLGMDYVGRKDEMHAEVNLSRGGAVALAARLQAAPHPAAAKPRPGQPVTYPTLGRLRYGTTHSHVRLLAARLHALGFYKGTVGSTYTWQVRQAVAAFQRRQGWRGSDANGLMGPETYTRLFGRRP